MLNVKAALDETGHHIMVALFTSYVNTLHATMQWIQLLARSIYLFSIKINSENF